ncbi:MAG: CoA-binding protein [Candidatus Aenigmatarchaeota archaeon]
MPTSSNLDVLFAPASIALIGASRTPGKVGYSMLENIKKSFVGPIYPINPEATEIAGLNAFPSITEVPEPVDLAVIAVKAEIVPNVLDECIKKKVKAIIVISAGFSEIGNKKGEEELQKLIKGKNIRLLGPNCLGVFSKSLDTLFLPRDKLKRPPEGQISFLTQSGAVGATMLDLIGFEGVGVSKFISYGNAADVNELEILGYLGKDMATRAIAMYIETIHDGPEFIKIASKITPNKPIVALKAGKTEKGSEAVLSHTGHMAGPAQVYSAAFRQAGIIEAQTTQDLFDFAKALSSQPPLRTGKIAVITNGGGFGILAADAAVKAGLELPDLSNETVKALKSVIPDYSVPKNPVDLSGDANAERYETALKAVANDKNIEGMLVIPLVQTPELDEKIVDVLRDAKIHGKSIVACMMGGEYTMKHARRLEGFGIPVYDMPERAVKALAALRDYGRIVSPPAPEKVEEKIEKKAKKLLAKKAAKKARKKGKS